MPAIDINNPDLWRSDFPWPKPDGNKYDRGHALIVGGPLHSAGATKLAARAALRSGAGLVSVACDMASLPLYAAAFTSIMTKPVAGQAEFEALLAAKTVRGVLAGPGTGVTPRTRDFTLATLRARKAVVLDADALTVFAGDSDILFNAITTPCILTPHAGEFARLFPDIDLADRVAAAEAAAARAGAVVVLKGTDTIIAAPDGRTCINRAASSFLATAGTGDVLAGLCLGLVTQDMPVFAAACAAVWLHAACADALGPGLISEDLPEKLPQILRELFA